MLPADPGDFASDRTAREIVSLNLFVGIQECVALASHVLSDAGWGVPRTYGAAFTALAEHGVISPANAARLRAAAGLRNLLAHQYGTIDLGRLHEFARDRLEDLLIYCDEVIAWSEGGLG